MLGNQHWWLYNTATVFCRQPLLFALEHLTPQKHGMLDSVCWEVLADGRSQRRNRQRVLLLQLAARPLTG